MAYLGECPDESTQVKAALAALGLAWPELWQAIRDGEEQRQTANRYQPRSAGGLKDWIARVGTLRETLDGRDWRYVDDYQIPLSINPHNTLGVGVLLGNEKTGQEPASAQGPRSRYPKGPKVAEVAARNEQLELPLTELNDPAQDDQDVNDVLYPELEVWFLVTYRVIDLQPPDLEAAVRVYSELSLPGRTSGTTTPVYIDRWLKRIPLPPSTFRLNPQTPPDADENLGDIPEGL
ncbi:hypothetical protein amrb99_15980 [Actinomadura sp. RB99]|uniref:hypothetical protein n=1 Tax=Actinomadura sp. RB99 TaxID=2691577 RepID=UPI001688B663|nr:hypothetical protein [Actinomadura sp. RB99]MBD2892686.1 hypothetical protein [Actinomadura sp. RB99]